MVKKTARKKNENVKNNFDPELLMAELRAGFDLISGKLDAIVTKTSAVLSMINTERDPGFKTEATVNKKFNIPRDNFPRERKMHKAVCAECNADCEVPFVPRSDRPVYCKTCYSGRKNESNQVSMPNREDIVAEISKTLNINIDSPAASKEPKIKKTAAKAKKSGKPEPKKAKTRK